MKRLLSLAALAAALLFLVRASGADDDASAQAGRWGESAVRKAKRGDLDGAIADLSQAVRLVPDDAFYWVRRAELWVKKKDHGKAASDYTRAIDRYLVDYRQKGLLTGLILAIDMLAFRADCKLAQGDVAGALADHTRAVELGPDHTKPLIRKAEFELSQKMIDRAMADFDKAVALEPTRSSCWEARGKARYALRRYDGALADYTKAIECDRAEVEEANRRRKGGDSERKENVNLLYQRACIRLDKEDFAASIADFTAVIAVSSKHAWTWHNRGEAKRLSKDVAGATADQTRAIELDPKEAKHWYARGLAKLDGKDPAGAMEDLAKATQLDPTSFGAHAYLGDAAFRIKDWARAIAAYSKAIELRPGQASVWFWRGRARYADGAAGDAEADFTKAIELHAKDAEARWWRARVRRERGDGVVAMEDYAKALELDPRGWRYLQVGWAQYELGLFAEAGVSLRKACELDPAQQEYARTFLFLLDVRAGDLDGARRGLAAYLAARKDAPKDDWYATLASFLLGESSEADLLAAADRGPEGDRAAQRCEAGFYAGSLRLVAGEVEAGRALLQTCLDTGRKGEPEFLAARAALAAPGDPFRGSFGGAMGHRKLDADLGLDAMEVELPPGLPRRATVTLHISAGGGVGSAAITIEAAYADGRLQDGVLRFAPVPWTRTSSATGQKDRIDGNPLVLRGGADGWIQGELEGDGGFPFTLTKRAAGTTAPPPSAPVPSDPADSPFTWTVPEGWVETPPGNGMRLAQFDVGKDADGEPVRCLVYARIAGSDEENVAQWTAQMGADAAKDAKSTASEHDGVKITRLEARGSYTDTMREGGAKTTTPATLLAAIVTGPKGRLLAKLVGPSAVVDAQTAKFDAWIASMRAR